MPIRCGPTLLTDLPRRSALPHVLHPSVTIRESPGFAIASILGRFLPANSSRALRVTRVSLVQRPALKSRFPALDRAIDRNSLFSEHRANPPLSTTSRARYGVSRSPKITQSFNSFTRLRNTSYTFLTSFSHTFSHTSLVTVDRARLSVNSPGARDFGSQLLPSIPCHKLIFARESRLFFDDDQLRVSPSVIRAGRPVFTLVVVNK